MLQPFPLQTLLARVARNEEMWGVDYLAGAGRRLSTTRRLLQEAGVATTLWARPAEARVAREDGGLLTETLAILVYEDRHWSILDTEVLDLDALAWDRLLRLFVSHWWPQHANVWHYVQPATDDPERIEDWLPEETGPGLARIEHLVAQSVAEWLENGTAAATGRERRGRL